jgi:phage shock protein PspC (stress-responsive transcriptional regulator)
MMEKKLYRSQNKVLGGVVGGITEYFNWSLDPNIVRILYALLVLGGFGVGIIVYIIAWVIIPENPVKEI